LAATLIPSPSLFRSPFFQSPNSFSISSIMFWFFFFGLFFLNYRARV
jgi:hypothetical protein